MLVLCVSLLKTEAQSIESIFPEIANCKEINLLALDAIPDFYQRQALDSIELILDFVGLKCIESPTLRITRFLLLIEQHRFSDSILTKLDLHIIKKESKHLRRGHLYDFTGKANPLEDNNPVHIGNVIWKQRKIEEKYVEMLAMWAEKLSLRTDNNKLETAVINHLQTMNGMTATPGLWGLSAKANGYYSLTETYNGYHRDFVILRSWQFTLGAGTFRPTGDLKPIMGNRSNFMFSIGKNFGHPKNRIDFGGSFTFGSSKRSYQVTTQDTSFMSNDGYASFGYLDFVRNIWRPNRFWEWNVSLGAGFAEKGIYSPLREDETIENEPAEIINDRMGAAFRIKPAAFAGTEFKWFFSSGTAINLQARYCLFNWRNSGGTSLSGNTLLLNAGLTFHFSGHPASGVIDLFSAL